MTGPLPCDPGCTCRGSGAGPEGLPPARLRDRAENPAGDELLRMLADARSAQVRRHMIAHATATQVACPHCGAGVGADCVTFPACRPAAFPHARRLALRLAQVPVPG